MNDYSWIKPHVKAVIINSRSYPELIGEVITIAGYPEEFISDYDKLVHLGVFFNESEDFIRRVGSTSLHSFVRVVDIKPYRDDDQEDNKFTEWFNNNVITDIDLPAKQPVNGDANG